MVCATRYSPYIRGPNNRLLLVRNSSCTCSWKRARKKKKKKTQKRPTLNASAEETIAADNPIVQIVSVDPELLRLTEVLARALGGLGS